MKPVKLEPLLEKLQNLLFPHRQKRHDPETPATASVDLNGLRVLLVEDNAINRQIARQLLEMAGVEVTGVSNGAGAVEAADSATFDVILMDIELPDMNGMKATRLIKKMDANATTPVIALTAHSWASHRKAYREAGMEFCIEKPIDIDELYHTIGKAVKR